MSDVQGVEKGNGAEREDDPGAERGGARGAGVEGDGLDPPVQARTEKQKIGILVFLALEMCKSLLRVIVF